MSKPKRRWHRAVIPFAIVLTLIFGSIIARAIEEPDRDDPSYLSVAVAGPDDGSRVAAAVRERGITVRHYESSAAALKALWSLKGQATLFVAAPEFMHPMYLQWLKFSPEGTRIVLVEPDGIRAAAAAPNLHAEPNARFATKATQRGENCTLTEAGTAAVTRTRYTFPPDTRGQRCYDGGLVSVEFEGIEFVATGSADPFREARVQEHDNARLAADLLSARPTLLWLDLHGTEQEPGTAPSSGTGELMPSQQPPIEIPIPNGEEPPQEEGSGQAPVSAYPTWVWFVVLILLLAIAALAMALGRRLGRPVTEPVPVRVPAAETARGRGRLYRRAKARAAAIETLRAAARRKIAAALDLPPNATREQFPARYGDVLFGETPETDQELTEQAAAVQAVIDEVLREKK